MWKGDTRLRVCVQKLAMGCIECQFISMSSVLIWSYIECLLLFTAKCRLFYKSEESSYKYL